MRLKSLELVGFKSFGQKTSLLFPSAITALVGPNGAGKSNLAEAVRFVLGERSPVKLRGQRSEDLIFNGGGGAARFNRAAVTLVLDNADRKFNLDYEEVTIAREIYRDGESAYFLNGSAVRLKDLHESLPPSLRWSEHLIINEGEADRVLRLTSAERRTLVEEALGLRVYRFKIAQSERKLEQTKTNLEKLKALRQEIAPHLRFLKKQAEKIAQKDRLRQELGGLYQEYLRREELYLEQSFKDLERERAGPDRELAEIQAKLKEERGETKPPTLVEVTEVIQTVETELTLAEELQEVQAIKKILAKIKIVLNQTKKRLVEFWLRSRESELHSLLASLKIREEKLQVERANFDQELTEGKLLVGEEILGYQKLAPEATPEGVDREDQAARRRKLERLKLRLEDWGGESEVTLKEYQAAAERDELLTKELTDLTESEKALTRLIKDLKEKIDQEFRTGLQAINRRFQEFFALMFGGGSARLVLTGSPAAAPIDDFAAPPAPLPPEAEPGIEIKVSLPRKKIKGLEMLSGGERALTSIALLFAMSQVKPPPFLILDETDAALDESNSRKYAELLKELAKQSQLILITHNRETMLQAGVLYGVTMGRDGVSRLLSVKLEEALANYHAIQTPGHPRS